MAGAREPRQNDRLFRADVIEHAEDLHLKFLDFAAREDRLPHAFHSGPYVPEREDRGLSAEHARRQDADRKSHNPILVCRLRSPRWQEKAGSARGDAWKSG